MCGIAGIIGRIGPDNSAALDSMSRALRHRGPDDEGTWVGPPDERGFGCLLSHRRLSILDLSSCGHQPMVDPISGQVLDFNGEIYNYADLRHELLQAGQEFQSTGDTAVMLRAMAVWGIPEAVRRFRGMFAFGLWDQRARRLTLARDPLGIKPLYFCRNPEPQGDWSLIFASEVRAILASGLLKKPKLDPSAVASLVWNGFVVGPGTAVRGVESVSPGQLVQFDERGRPVSAEYFWTLARREADPATPKVSEEEATRAIEESVRLHLISDVPLGVFLSGGIDSSAIANLAQRQSAAPVHTFTLTFEEAAFNEGAYARRVAKALGTSHREVVLTESRFLQTIRSAAGSLDQPTFDGLNSFFVSQAVREGGITVALTGTGGDELFGGYTSFSRLTRLLRLVRGGVLGRQAGAMAARVASAIVAASRGGDNGPLGSQAGWVKLPEILAGAPNILTMYQVAYALFLPRFQRELLGEQCAAAASDDGLSDTFRNQSSAELAGRSPLSGISLLEQRIFLGERLLRDTDAASMAVSLETRLPLVDQNLSKVLDGMDDRVRFHPLGQKALLRRIGLKGLDPALFSRPKAGFVLPFDSWIRKGMGPAIAELLLDARCVAAVGLRPKAVTKLWAAFADGRPRIYWSRVWAVYALIQWCHEHGVLL